MAFLSTYMGETFQTGMANELIHFHLRQELQDLIIDVIVLIARTLIMYLIYIHMYCRWERYPITYVPWVLYTEKKKCVSTWLRELHYCSCLSVLSSPVWVLLSYVLQIFTFSPVHLQNSGGGIGKVVFLYIALQPTS